MGREKIGWAALILSAVLSSVRTELNARHVHLGWWDPLLFLLSTVSGIYVLCINFKRTSVGEKLWIAVCTAVFMSIALGLFSSCATTVLQPC